VIADQPGPRSAIARLRAITAPAVLAIILPLFAWAALTYPGYLQTHSGLLPVWNLNDLRNNLTNFSWAPVVGQPYDLLRGERFLPYMLGVVFTAFGAASATAVKWVFGVCFVAGSVGMYGWTRRRLGAWPALIAATIYTYLPVGLATTYVRGAFAEAALLALMPWLLWAADACRGWTPLNGLSLGLACAVWTQTGMTLWVAAILLAYLIVMRAQRSVFIAWAAGLVLGAVGLLPVILRDGSGGATYVAFGDHLVYANQILSATWGAGPSNAGPYDTLTLSLGFIAFGLAILSLFLPRAVGDEPRVGRVPAFAWAIVLLAVFLSSTFAAQFWRIGDFLNHSLTYPWQLLLIAAPWLAWLAGQGAARLLDMAGPEGENNDRGHVGLPIVAGLLVLIVLPVYTTLGPVRAAFEAADPIPAAPLAIFGDNEIALLSVEPEGAPGPGGEVKLAVRWQALRPLDRNYTVFYHVIGPDGQRYGQQDTMPQDGQLPTTQWQPGVIVSDEYRATLAANAPGQGDYQDWVGFYLLDTGQRLKTNTGDDKYVVGIPATATGE
jgi:hypothetical protein